MKRTLAATLKTLDGIVDEARASNSPIGIFPAMYRSVTASIDRAVHEAFFGDSVAMEHLAITFADRYVDAYRDWSAGRPITESWRVAFEAATDGRKRMIAQHLLAGMNAHINLDLGIATAEVIDGAPETIRADFLRVNRILFGKLDGLQDALGGVSRRMAWIDRMGWRIDERLMEILIGDARDGAWELAVRLSEDRGSTATIVRQRDIETATLGRRLVGGSLPVRAASRIVAATEPKRVDRVLDAFMS